MNWQELSTTSHYQTALAVKDKLKAGEVEEAVVGLDELIDAVARSERRALRSQLIRLMVHVIKWLTQPERRSGSWAVTIYQSRDEIAAIMEEVPSLTRTVLEEMWDGAFTAASRQARAEMGDDVATGNLSWHDVFESEYSTVKAQSLRSPRRTSKKTAAMKRPQNRKQK